MNIMSLSIVCCNCINKTEDVKAEVMERITFLKIPNSLVKKILQCKVSDRDTLLQTWVKYDIKVIAETYKTPTKIIRDNAFWKF